MIVEVLVDVKHQAVDHVFDYAVPNHLSAYLELGQRVKVPFGHRQISGIIVHIKSTSDVQPLKEVIALIDLEPLYSKELIDLAFELAKNHFGITLSYLHAMVPNALKMRYKKRLIPLNLSQLPKALQEKFKRHQAIAIEDSGLPYRQLQHLIEEKKLEIITEFQQKLGIYHQEYVYLRNVKKVKGSKQNAIIKALQENDGQLKPTLLKTTASSHATLNSLLKKDIITIESVESHRVITSLIKLPHQEVTLNNAQTDAYEQVKNTFGRYQAFLLHGITSSGKTEVYIKLVEACLNDQKSALVLVPEISLTPNLAARFKAKFNDRVVLYHSRLSEGERYDEWRKAKQQKARVMIGARSAVFAPLNNLGIIIIDEEHSDAYRQEDPPKYNAIDVAIRRAKHHHIPILLGSATPSVERYYQAVHQDITLLTLKERALNSVLPTVEIVDMREELYQGNTSIFSKKAQAAITQSLAMSEQVLILINRRGHANFVLCRECGQAIRCPECELTMTYHHAHKSLKCHYCHVQEPMPITCPYCSSKHIRYMGIGSERVEAVLNETFKDAEVIRMDHDTTQQKNAHEQLLYTFENRGDILVGTQMISKGLDFDRVRCVIILSADMALNIPDYYAKEEAFQLFMQMAGRSGRRASRGQVILQAYEPNHPVLTYVKNHDYTGFYNDEIAQREILYLPPFSQTLQLTIKHHSKNQSHLKTLELLRELKKTSHLGTRIIGPITPKYARMQKQYRTQILIKTTAIDQWKATLRGLIDRLDFKDTVIQIDDRLTL